MGLFPSGNKRLPEWQLSLSPEEQKKRRQQEREARRSVTPRQKTTAGRSKRAGSEDSHASGSREASGSRGTSGSGFLRDAAVAFGWAFADATVWCVAPEAWTTNVALRKPSRTGAITFVALAGSLTGGAFTYTVAKNSSKRESAGRLLRVPGVSEQTIRRAETEVKKYGAKALASGLVEPVPYKAYARALGHNGTPMQEFLLWSAMARITPLTVLTTGVGVLSAVSRKAAPRLTRAAGPLALNAGWVAYYAWRLSGTGKR
ncbi:hypothetical protein AB0X98_08360 [Rothia koreensis]|uniref:hypothetical protein n=1 Tax=Rothia koreensis TaxID=592378 RepID=UPI003F236340